jgi:hypothetical protein
LLIKARSEQRTVATEGYQAEQTTLNTSIQRYSKPNTRNSRHRFILGEDEGGESGDFLRETVSETRQNELEFDYTNEASPNMFQMKRVEMNEIDQLKQAVKKRSPFKKSKTKTQKKSIDWNTAAYYTNTGVER